jgi:hypothetical protein
METTAGSLIGVGLVLLAAAVSWVASQLAGLRGDLKQAFRSTLEERIARVAAQTEANKRLIETPEGRAIFFDYMISEAALFGLAMEIEHQMKTREQKIEELREELKDMNGKRDNMLNWAKKFFKAHGGTIAETVLKKANELVGGMIPGAHTRKKT